MFTLTFDTCFYVQYPYHLHSVLVHEGQAVSGHYWSFIYDERRSKWLKFNDITVSESSEEEMHKESVGGFHNASAYCLMYVDRSRQEHGQGGFIDIMSEIYVWVILRNMLVDSLHLMHPHCVRI